jgi:hypothetical protein
MNSPSFSGQMAVKAIFIWQAKKGKSSGLSVSCTPFLALGVNIRNGNGKSFVRGTNL